MVHFPSDDPGPRRPDPGNHPGGGSPRRETGPDVIPTPSTRASLSEQTPHSTVERLTRLGDEIAELQAHLHAATYRMLERLREFDTCFQEAGGGLGFRSTAHWLSWRTGIGLGSARERVRVARALSGLPRMGAAMERGALSYSKLRAVTRIATPDSEERLLEFALDATAAELERLVRVWRRADRLDGARGQARDPQECGNTEPTESEREARRRERRELSLYVDVDGSYVVKGRLEPEVGALLKTALEASTELLYRSEEEGSPDEPPTSAAQRRADAVGLLAQVALQGSEAPQATELRTLGRSDRFQVVVHVDAQVLAERGRAATDRKSSGAPQATTGAGSGEAPCGCSAPVAAASGRKYGDGRSWLGDEVGVSAETSRRLSCDAGPVVMTHAPDGSVLNVGRRSRVVPAPIRRALQYRDGGCRFPGCGLRICEPHHITHWAHGGETRLENLVLLCRRHHRAVHEGGWQVTMHSDSDPMPRFFAPDGAELPPAPPLPPAPTRPVNRLREEHRFLGLHIHAWTASSRASGGGWDSSALDLNWALSALRRPNGREP
jgi:hypothetical protein